MKSAARVFRFVVTVVFLALVGGFAGAVASVGSQPGFLGWVGRPGNPPPPLPTRFVREGLVLGALVGVIVASRRLDRSRGLGGPAVVSNQSLALERSVLLRRRDDSPEVEVRLYSVYREKWRRILVVHGSVEGEIEYNPIGLGERVFFNGEQVARTSGINFWSMQLVTVAPKVEFELRGQGRAVPACIEVTVYDAFWKGLKDFRLFVAGRLVYEEVAGEILTERGRVLTGPPGGEPARDHVG